MIDFQQPIVWITAAAALVVIAGVWLRRRRSGSAAPEVRHDSPASVPSEPPSSLANIMTGTPALAGDLHPEPARPAEASPVAPVEAAAIEDPKPRKSAAARKSGRKKPAPKKPSPKKSTRKK
jgi:hypothetical protein